LEVDKYIDFLKYKHSQNDWADELSEQQIQLVEKGKKDIEENRIITHKEAKEKIKNHIRNKAL
jgi:predicted transcriptional regulator